MAVAAKFGTASDAERSLVFLTIINDLGLGYCFHLDEFELVVDDREELQAHVPVLWVAATASETDRRILTEMARTWTPAASELRAAWTIFRLTSRNPRRRTRTSSRPPGLEGVIL